jgi:predicted GNAT family acetyltransferase
MSDMELTWIKLPHRIYAKNDDGKVICEITFPETGSGVCTIDHTFVDDDARGMGLASRLVESAVNEIEDRGEKAEATCQYASKWMKEHGKK